MTTRALLLIVLAAAACGGGSDVALERIAPDSEVRGRVIGPDGARLDRFAPIDVAFVDGERGLMSTRGGLLMRTADGGRTWERVASGRALANLEMLSPRLVFATSATSLVQSADGGSRWRAIGRVGRVTDLDFVGPRHGWIWNGRLRRTTDGGASWRTLRVPCPEYFAGVSFLDAARGFLVCGDQPATIQQRKTLYTTTDGGGSWKRLRAELPWDGHAVAIAFRDADDGLLVANRVGVFATRDGGRHWRTRLFTDDITFVSKVSRPTPTRVYALLMSGELLRSDDRAAHWRRAYPRHARPPVESITFSSATDGIAAGEGGWPFRRNVIVATRDGGRSWSPRATGPVDMNQLERSGPKTVWAVARADLFRSGDDGRTWRRVRTPRVEFMAVSFPSPRVGFLMANDGRIFRTEDAGGTWSRVHSRGRDLRTARFVSAERGFAVAERELLHTRDGGRTWQAVPVGIRLIGGDFLDERHWWLVGNRGILRTSDAGRHWQLIRLQPPPGSIVFEFVSPSVGYAKDPWGGPYRTTDGGRSWRYVYPRR